MIESELTETPIATEASKPKRNVKKYVFVLLLLTFSFAVTLLLHILSLNEPVTLTEPVTIMVEQGETVSEITSNLKAAGVVRSEQLLYFILSTQFDTTQIKASRYEFWGPLTTYQVAEKLISGEFDNDLTSVTVIEGESIAKIAERLEGTASWFDRKQFLIDTQGLEGELFPETYFVPEDFSTTEFVTLLHSTYKEVISLYEENIATNGFTEKELITFASIVEREANTEMSMHVVAGIFQNRLEIKMPLQADATIEYVLDEGLHELAPGELAANLRKVDSPYNTYLYPGLPPTPIGNPGQAAIEAVLFPTESNYLYYITGNDGEFYYAETYNQHLINIDRHLK